MTALATARTPRRGAGALTPTLSPGRGEGVGAIGRPPHVLHDLPAPYPLPAFIATVDPEEAAARPREAAGGPALAEREVLALWLLGRVPPAVLSPWVLLRPGRAGRGPGPDVREATFQLPGGLIWTGDVEIHVRARDFARHGHESDPAYDGVVLHVVWDDDRVADGPRAAGEPVPLAGGGEARTVAIAPWLSGGTAELRALVRRGPSGHEPCADAGATFGAEETSSRLRHEGQRRLAERTWRAARLAATHGWTDAWSRQLDAALAASAGRTRESAEERAQLASRITTALCKSDPAGPTGREPLLALARLARTGMPRGLIEALRGGGGGGARQIPHAHDGDITRLPTSGAGAVGTGRAAELGWNAVLPLLGALALGYGDTELARATARLASAWPAPRPYGRTQSLAMNLGGLGRDAATGGGALAAQGLLHLQDLWCERGGCGHCPLSPPAPQGALPAPAPQGALSAPPHSHPLVVASDGPRAAAVADKGALAPMAPMVPR